MNPNVNYRLWVIMMHQCRFMDSNKGTTLVGEVDNGGAVHVWGRGFIGNLCTFCSIQFCWEPKTALKNSLFLKKKNLNGIKSGMLEDFCHHMEPENKANPWRRAQTGSV